MSTKWITDRKKVNLFIHVDNAKIVLSIEYVSLEFERIEKEVSVKQVLEDF